MKQDYLWLPTSCFCSIKKWNLLLGEIKRFISCLTPDQFLSYAIQFSNFNGQSILFSILTTADKIDELGHQLDKHFTKFFDAGDGEKFAYEVTSIYLPFPTATIQFGLYNINFNESLISQYKIDEKFSGLMIDALSGDDITPETIITFAFYLQVSLIKVLYSYLDDIDGLFLLITSINTKIDINLISDALNDNQTLMDEIMDEVMNADRFNRDMNWLNEWIDLCKSALPYSKEAVYDKHVMVKKIYENNVKMIYKHLDINVQNQGLLYHLTYKSSQRFFK